MKTTLTRDFYKFDKYQYHVDPETGTEIGIDGLFAIGFSGKRSKPDFNYQFYSIAQRDRYIADYLTGLRRQAEAKKQREIERKNYRHNYQKGDILYSSWGYEQTNINFYQVVDVRDKSIIVMEIAGELVADGAMTGKMTAVKDAFIEGAERTTRVVNPGGGIRISSYEWANKWDGQPKRYSSYA